MRNTADTCIMLISDSINQVKTNMSAELSDWEEIVNSCKKHEISCFLYSQCSEIIPTPYNKEIEQQFSAALFFYANRIEIEKEIKERLNEKGIESFIVKGSLIAEYYPKPFFRTMGDTDLVVHRKDRDDVHAMLLSMGFHNQSKYDDREWVYEKNGMKLELHDHLVYLESVNGKGHEEFFNDFWKYVTDGKLDWSFHFLFLIFHMRKHFMYGGIGFRHFADIAVLTKYNMELDWEWIEDNLKELNMFEFAQKIFELNKAWFDIVPPLNMSGINREFVEDAKMFIDKNGIFGISSEEKLKNQAVNKVRKNERKNLGVSRVLKGLFPSYSQISKVDKYSFLVGRKYLLPAAWVYRAVSSIKERRSKTAMKSLVRVSFVSKKEIEEREKVLREWGL